MLLAPRAVATVRALAARRLIRVKYDSVQPLAFRIAAAMIVGLEHEHVRWVGWSERRSVVLRWRRHIALWLRIHRQVNASVITKSELKIMTKSELKTMRSAPAVHFQVLIE